VINAGYLKETAHVVRCIGDDHEPTLLSSWCAKLIAMIGQPPDTVGDRSILVPLKRRAQGEKVTRLRADRLESGALMLRRQATRWARDHASEVTDPDPQVPEYLDDRAADNWRPLIALADAAGGHWPETARKAARTLSGNRDDREESASVLLLGDIRTWFEEPGARSNVVETVELLSYLASMETRPWAQWRDGKGLDPIGLAKLLRGYDIQPKSVRIGTRSPKAYRRQQFEDAWTRYLPSTRNSRNNPIDTAKDAVFQPATPDDSVAAPKRETLNDSGHVAGVADGTRYSEGDLLI
jgi:hypothetical protein